MNKIFAMRLIGGACMLAISTNAVSMNSAPPKRYAQFMVGNQPLDESWSVRDDADNEYHANLEAVRLLGFALQTPRAHGKIQHGFEGAGSIGYDSHRKIFVRLGGDGSRIDVDSNLWAGDFSAGIFISLKPVTGLRIFAAAGPNIYWGRLGESNENSATTSQDGSIASGDLVIDTRTDDYDIGLDIYARAGIDFIFPNGFVLGASVRQHNGELDFGRNGKIDVNQPQYLLTLGSYF